MRHRGMKRIAIVLVMISLTSPSLFSLLGSGLWHDSLFDLSYSTRSQTSWLSGWEYRKTHLISGSVGAGTNYQVRVTVHSGSGTDLGEDVYCGGLCAPDFDDIRFTGDDGITVLDHWRESFQLSDYAVFWVEVASSLDSDVTTYVYWGNDAASDSSSGAGTFLLYDHFSAVSLDSSKWREWFGFYGTYALASSELHIWGVTDDWEIIGSKTEYQSGKAFEYRAKFDEQNYVSVGADERTSDGTSSGGNDESYWRYDSYATYQKYVLSGCNGAVQESARGSTLTSYTRLTMGWATGAHVKFWEDGSLVASHTTQVPADTMGVSFNVHGPATDIYVDWVAVRKYMASEPQHGMWGARESASTAATTTSTTITTTSDNTGVLDSSVLVRIGLSILLVAVAIGIIAIARRTRKSDTVSAVTQERSPKPPPMAPRDEAARKKLVLGALKSYPRISMNELSALLGISAENVRTLTLHLIADDSVHGTFDKSSDEFVSASAAKISREIKHDSSGLAMVQSCPHCGAALPWVLGTGESRACPSCGRLIAG